MCSNSTIVIMIAAIIAVLVLASGGEGQTANNYRITITGGTTESFSNTGFGIEQQSGTTSQSYSYISGFTRTINEFRIVSIVHHCYLLYKAIRDQRHFLFYNFHAML